MDIGGSTEDGGDQTILSARQFSELIHALSPPEPTYVEEAAFEHTRDDWIAGVLQLHGLARYAGMGARHRAVDVKGVDEVAITVGDGTGGYRERSGTVTGPGTRPPAYGHQTHVPLAGSSAWDEHTKGLTLGAVLTIYANCPDLPAVHDAESRQDALVLFLSEGGTLSTQLGQSDEGFINACFCAMGNISDLALTFSRILNEDGQLETRYDTYVSALEDTESYSLTELSICHEPEYSLADTTLIDDDEGSEIDGNDLSRAFAEAGMDEYDHLRVDVYDHDQADPGQARPLIAQPSWM